MNKKTYLIAAVILFLAEIAILIFWEKNLFIRGFLGDVLAVLFLYAAIKSIVNIKSSYGIFISFAVGVLLEIGQYFNFAKLINMQDNRIFNVVFGSRFDWKDIVAYFIGTMMLFACEKYFIKKIKFL